jgi:GTP cyclohydrolase I
MSALLQPLDELATPQTVLRSAARPRSLTPELRRRFEAHLAEILAALGMDLDEAGTAATPRRFLDALLEATDGYEGDPKLVTTFPTECRGGADCELAQVVEGPIAFVGLCEHHAMPFFGRAYVAYVAHDRIIGISKLTRLVRVLTRRFGVQERMTHDIADDLATILGAHGVAVLLEGHHLCTEMRGVREQSTNTRTTAYRGTFERDSTLRREFLDMVRSGGG